MCSSYSKLSSSSICSLIALSSYPIRLDRGWNSKLLADLLISWSWVKLIFDVSSSENNFVSILIGII